MNPKWVSHVKSIFAFFGQKRPFLAILPFLEHQSFPKMTISVLIPHWRLTLFFQLGNFSCHQTLFGCFFCPKILMFVEFFLQFGNKCHFFLCWCVSMSSNITQILAFFPSYIGAKFAIFVTSDSELKSKFSEKCP